MLGEDYIGGHDLANEKHPLEGTGLVPDDLLRKTLTVHSSSPAFKGGKKRLYLMNTTNRKGDDFYFVQRTGRNSVAFACFDRGQPNSILALAEFSSIYNALS